jgi:demethylmenaquinone methyltransferase/2-methoxy-6-polyprenyl-1,4-benzoquinol methylase
MDTETFAKSKFGRIFIKILAAGMESRFRYRFFPPMKILKGADIVPGKVVLEIGCGTGFFTIPAAQLIGDQGSLTAMDVVQESVDLVFNKIQEANLKNVRVVKGNAMDTRLDSESFDNVLLFGVIPAPMLSLNRLLPEIHRILKVEGNLAVWPPIPGWLPQSIIKSGLFTLSSKRNGVSNFKRQ